MRAIVARMTISRWKKRRGWRRNASMELTGALSVASQMALLCPPGFDEWVRQELAGDNTRADRDERRPAGLR